MNGDIVGYIAAGAGAVLFLGVLIFVPLRRRRNNGE